jgi:hypothetical protein
MTPQEVAQALRGLAKSLVVDNGGTGKLLTDSADFLDILSSPDLKETIADALYNDAAHHKQWYLWRITELLELDLSDQWDEEFPEPEQGVAP